jgi:hypothetical protein
LANWPPSEDVDHWLAERRRFPVRPLTRTALAVGLSQHAHQHRPKRPVLLAVDQELGERPRLGVPVELADPVGPLEVGEHQDVEQLGAGSGTERVEAGSESAFQLVGSHGRRLRPTYRRSRTLVCLSALGARDRGHEAMRGGLHHVEASEPHGWGTVHAPHQVDLQREVGPSLLRGEHVEGDGRWKGAAISEDAHLPRLWLAWGHD